MSTTSRASSPLPAGRRVRVADATDTVFDPRQILRVLGQRGIEFVVVGGVAVQAHGYLRPTQDLDVIPRPSLINLSRLGEALAELGARTWRARRTVDVADRQLFERAALVPLITDHGRLDLLNLQLTTGAPNSYDELREAAVEVELGGYTVAVAGLDDLIRMKRAAGREQDLADIGAITRSDEELEREAAEST
jgi:predicted nucleotidyltransferase